MSDCMELGLKLATHFLQSCNEGIRRHKCEAHTANATRDCKLGAAAPEFEAEAGHIGPAVQEVQYAEAEQEPMFRVLQAHQTLPPESWEPFDQVAQLLLDELNAAIVEAEQEGPGPARAAWNDIKLFHSCTLSENKDSQRKDIRLNTLLGKILGGENLQAPDSKKLSGKLKRAQKHKWYLEIAQRLQGHLKRGNVKRAAQCLDQASHLWK